MTDLDALYQTVRNAVAANPVRAPETILRAMTDGQREAHEKLLNRSRDLDFMWLAALGYAAPTPDATPAATKYILAQAMISRLRNTPSRSQIENDALALLEKEVLKK